MVARGFLDVSFGICRCAYYVKKVNLHLDVYENSVVPFPKKKLKYRQVYDIMHSYFFALTFLDDFAQTIVMKHTLFHSRKRLCTTF